MCGLRKSYKCSNAAEKTSQDSLGLQALRAAKSAKSGR